MARLRAFLLAFLLVALGSGLAQASPPYAVLAEPRASGDLNGDGRDDLAVVVERRLDGGRTQVVVAVFERQLADGWRWMTAVRLEDGAMVDRLRLSEGRLTASFRDHYPIDPPCCPTRAVVRSFGLADGRLHGPKAQASAAFWRGLAETAFAK